MNIYIYIYILYYMHIMHVYAVQIVSTVINLNLISIVIKLLIMEDF